MKFKHNNNEKKEIYFNIFFFNKKKSVNLKEMLLTWILDTDSFFSGGIRFKIKWIPSHSTGFRGIQLKFALIKLKYLSFWLIF